MSEKDVQRLCAEAAHAAASARLGMARLSGDERVALLEGIARAIRGHEGEILEANARDVEAARSGSRVMSEAMIDRLRLDAGRVGSMAGAVEAIAAQSDPVGEVVEGRVLGNGVRIEKRRVPIGVVAVIYESRPNVTSDAAALCIRSGNAVVLKGGSEAHHSNRAIVGAIHGALRADGLEGAVSFVDTTDRSAVRALVTMPEVIDLVIPRGGPGLIHAVMSAATVPVIKHDAGNCHVYLDQHLDGLEERAVEIVVNAKAQRPGVCNAAETLLVHRARAKEMVPRVCAGLAAAGVEVRGDETVRRLFAGAKAADESDWDAEYLDLILAVRVVESLDEAARHIRAHGSKHTEAIVTSLLGEAERFVSLVDSASVMINCSTRFADGGMYGLGAEIGISTNKLHARGPMGAADLTTYQWVLTGSGQVRV